MLTLKDFDNTICYWGGIVVLDLGCTVLRAQVQGQVVNGERTMRNGQLAWVHSKVLFFFLIVSIKIDAINIPAKKE